MPGGVAGAAAIIAAPLCRYVAILAATTATFYAFLAGAPIVLKGYGIGPDGIGWFIMAVPVSYILGNFMTSRLIAQAGESRVMAWGQVLTLGGLVVMLALGLGGVQTALAVALPLLLLGLAPGIAASEIEFSLGIPLEGSLAIPCRGHFVILGHADALAVAVSEQDLGRGIGRVLLLRSSP